MKYTVQCLCAIYQHNTVVVEADSVGEACGRATMLADSNPDWRPLDDVGCTFVQAIAEGEHDDAYGDTQCEVPESRTEQGLWKE